MCAQRLDPIVDLQIGREMRRLRMSRDLTEEKVAGILGTSVEQLRKYETGKSRLAASRLYRLAQALEVSVGTFFEGLEPPTRTRTTHAEADAILDLAGVPRHVRDAIVALVTSIARDHGRNE